MKTYAGNPTGTGNPPGQYDKSYLKSTEKNDHFVGNKSYRGSMHVGVSDSANNIGNQPKQKSTSTLEAFAKKPSI